MCIKESLGITFAVCTICLTMATLTLACKCVQIATLGQVGMLRHVLGG
jgi:hypothetical protein